MSLPIFQSDSEPMTLMQTSWAKYLRPFLENPFLQGRVLTGVVLTSGSNVVNHKLSRKLQGWVIVGQNASATFYDAQASNKSPQLTLVLIASGAVTINLYVF